MYRFNDVIHEAFFNIDVFSVQEQSQLECDSDHRGCPESPPPAGWLRTSRRTGQHSFGGSHRVLPEWRTQIVCHAAPPGRKNINELISVLIL